MERTEQDKIACPVIITGATGSMGAVAVRSLAAEGTPVIMACRNLTRGGELLEEVKKEFPDAALELMKLDLDSTRSVREFAGALAGRKIGGIFNNAGVISPSWSLTEDGMEHSMAVNFVNPSLLTMLLVPNFIQGARIVNMVSLTTRFVSIGEHWRDIPEKKFSRLPVYAKSKLAFLLFSIAFARKYPQLRVNVADPGVVNSKMLIMGKWYDAVAAVVFRPFTYSPEKGARPALRALKAEASLGYYVGNRVRNISRKYLEDPLSGSLMQYIESLL